MASGTDVKRQLSSPLNSVEFLGLGSVILARASSRANPINFPMKHLPKTV